MAKQHHFLVVIEDGVASIDYETLQFQDRDTWDTEAEQWYNRNDPAVAEDYDLAEQTLTNLLKQTWEN